MYDLAKTCSDFYTLGAKLLISNQTLLKIKKAYFNLKEPYKKKRSMLTIIHRFISLYENLLGGSHTMIMMLVNALKLLGCEKEMYDACKLCCCYVKLYLKLIRKQSKHSYYIIIGCFKKQGNMLPRIG